MKIAVQGKQMDVGDSLRAHIEDALKANTEKYFDKAVNGTATVSKDKHEFKSDITVHVGKEIRVQGRGQAGDAYAAVDESIERISKQLRRYKRRLRDHHREQDRIEIEAAQQTVFDGHEDVEQEPTAPAIVAEVDTKIHKLAVADAVMRMDLADLPVLVFRNSANGNVNVVYRREDGNIGWIDPATAESTSA
ncbi:ribosome-associated translation inhibitor RaiA [Terasakiella sp. A23]|uniref:ribosome hibernation-promoting factor, HPF/YfiA family n=1 Tax=Terasakiella sp. FCG-A23 TaxID=3080561 RepID=UPI002953CD4C|nr:ribosome-associated translation inhibitor RaiA [Terasakiella sp. A23]MDV7339467.1 ribosome-associated translation inhibitor RaiA [Terasakiella sp. A23]